jgi:hypothetical protein
MMLVSKSASRAVAVRGPPVVYTDDRASPTAETMVIVSELVGKLPDVNVTEPAPEDVRLTV